MSQNSNGTFFSHIRGFLNHRLRIDELWKGLTSGLIESQFPNRDLVNLSDGTFNRDFRQTSFATESKQPIQTSFELQEVGSTAKEILDLMFEDLIIDSELAPECLVKVPLKSLDRAQQKAFDDYSSRVPGPPISWIFDFVRYSIICETEVEIVSIMDLLLNHPMIQCIRLKNRFLNPTPAGFRDLNLNFRLDLGGQIGHTFEVQIHHKQILQFSHENHSHAHYEFLRLYLSGCSDTIRERMRMLDQIVNPPPPLPSFSNTRLNPSSPRSPTSDSLSILHSSPRSPSSSFPTPSSPTPSPLSDDTSLSDFVHNILHSEDSSTSRSTSTSRPAILNLLALLETMSEYGHIEKTLRTLINLTDPLLLGRLPLPPPSLSPLQDFESTVSPLSSPSSQHSSSPSLLPFATDLDTSVRINSPSEQFPLAETYTDLESSFFPPNSIVNPEDLLFRSELNIYLPDALKGGNHHLVLILGGTGISIARATQHSHPQWVPAPSISDQKALNSSKDDRELNFLSTHPSFSSEEVESLLEYTDHLLSLANILKSRSQFTESLDLIRWVVFTRVHLLCTDVHPSLSHALQSYSNILRTLGKTMESMRFAVYSLKIQYKYWGTLEHPGVVSTLNDVGGLLQQMGRQELIPISLSISKYCIVLQERVQGEGHISLAVLHANLGTSLKIFGKSFIDTAIESHKTSLNLRKRHFGERSTEVAVSQIHLAQSLLVRTGPLDLLASLQLYQSSVSILEELMGGRPNLDLAFALAEYSKLLLVSGQQELALVKVRQAVCLVRGISLTSHTRLAHILNQYGLVLLQIWRESKSPLPSQVVISVDLSEAVGAFEECVCLLRRAINEGDGADQRHPNLHLDLDSSPLSIVPSSSCILENWTNHPLISIYQASLRNLSAAYHMGGKKELSLQESLEVEGKLNGFESEEAKEIRQAIQTFLF